MSTRNIVVIGLVVLACVTVMALSALAQGYVAAAFGPFRFGEIFEGLARWGRRPLLPLPMFRRPPAGWRVLVSAVAGFAFLYLAGLLALFAAPRRLRVLRDALGHGGGALLSMIGIGMAGGIALTLLSLLGFFAQAAFPLPLLLPLAIIAVAWIGLVALALTLGRALGRWAGLAQPTPLLDLALGTLVLFSLGRIPIAGWVITALLGALGLGAVIATRFGTGRPWSLDEYTRNEELSA